MLDLFLKVPFVSGHRAQRAADLSFAQRSLVGIAGCVSELFAGFSGRTLRLGNLTSVLILQPARGSFLGACTAHTRASCKYGFMTLALIVALAVSIGGQTLCWAQGTNNLAQSVGSPDEKVARKLAERLKRGAEDPQKAKLEDNEYRGGVGSYLQVKENMKALFSKVLVYAGEQADKWYSPHLRDVKIDGLARKMEVDIRAKTVPLTPYRDIIEYCMNPWNWPIEAACPLTAYNLLGEVCYWHGEPFGPHRPVDTCFGRSTAIYQTLIRDSNFKTCCVQNAHKRSTTEQILADPREGYQNRRGWGWAGLYEYYFPATVIGWENDRTTTMIVEKAKVEKCVKDSEKLIPNKQGWVAGAIERNAKIAGGNANGVASKVAENINKVLPKEELRNTDSLQNEGLTVRPNFAALDPGHRRQLAERYCMHPAQFDKIMDLAEDPVQRADRPLENIPVWSNYCPQGVELMIDPEKSNMENIDHGENHTNFIEGMKAWRNDPLYCQRMNLDNPNMQKVGFSEVIEKVPGQKLGEAEVGYTCREGKNGEPPNLNGGLVPITFGRHAAVERRGALADHALGFLMAAGWAKTMRIGQKSYYKRFEPRPYSADLDAVYASFRGEPVSRVALPGARNERGDLCRAVGGERLNNSQQPRNTPFNQADRLYVSDNTHKPFTQDIVEDSGDQIKPNIEQRTGPDRYVQDWAKADSKSQAGIAKRRENADKSGDNATQNYATAFRIFATCPKGFTRWEPPEDVHNAGLTAQLNLHCGQEWLGGKPDGQMW